MSAADASGAAPATRVKSTASTRTATDDWVYPNGHLGHLKEYQQEALVAFKKILEERGVWKPGPPASHDDPLLLRFLRARRWIPEDAYKQFKDTEDWRAANDIGVLYKTIELDAYDSSRRLYPQWTGRRDRRGIPLYVFEVKTLDAKAVSEYEKLGHNKTFSEAKTDGKTPSGLLRLFALYENLTRFAMPFCTNLPEREHPEVPISMSTNIVDISGVGLKQFWNLKSHMQAASQLATAHYPETLDRIFVIGAPMFFSTVWGWIKRWFDPNTVSKIFVLGAHEVKPTLEAFIDPRNIPKRYGGELDFEFGQQPIPDPSWDGLVHFENGYTTFPGGPMVWEEVEVDGQEKVACISLGSKDGKNRRVTVCTMPKTFTMPAPGPQTNGVNEAEEGVQTEDVAEGTQTSEHETRDDAAQTDGDANAITNGDILEKLTIDEKVKEKTVEAPPAVPAAQAAVA